MKCKDKIGLVIGRFQIFHLGHLFLIREALKKVNRLKIGIGSANRNDEINPYSIDIRRKFINEMIKSEKIEDRIIGIYDLDDFPDNDEKWYLNVCSKVGEFDIYISNDGWTTKIFREHNHKVFEPEFFKRDIYQGSKIRDIMVKKGNWEELTPQFLIDIIRTLD